MPSPVSPSTLADLVPPRNGSFCGRFIPGIINWMQERANYWNWMYKANGDLTVSFITDLCIAKNGTVTPDPSTCPPIAFSAKVVPRNGVLRLTFTGVGMVAGSTWNLYRSSSVSGPWGSAITSGTTTGATISYNDSGLVNDTLYYYKLTVTKPGCPPVSFQTVGAPQLCITFDFQLTVTSSESGVVTVKAANVDPENAMDSTFLYEVLVNGSLASSGALSDHLCTLNDSPGLCLDLSSVTPGAGTIITVSIRENLSCTAVTHFETLTTVGTRPGQPRVIVANGGIIIQNNGTVIPVLYKLRRRAVGLCNTEPPSFYREFTVIPNVGANATYAISRTTWPCTENVIPPAGGVGGSPGYCKPKYEVWAIAVSSDGGMSDPSDVTLMDFPLVPLWPGQC